MAGRIRRPARGGVIKEFLVGLFGGLFVSLALSSLFNLHSIEFDHPKQLQLNTAAQSLTPADGEPVRLARDGEWRPKERLQGHKTPVILCAITQYLHEAIVPQVINATWGSRCDRLVFTSPRKGSDENFTSTFETVPVEKIGDRDEHWQTLRSFLANLQKLDEVDYVFVLNDRTYGIPDNIRYEYRGFHPGTEHLFWGRKDSNICSSKAFVLSRTTAIALQAKIKENESSCASSTGPIDQKLNKCLASLGVPCKDAVDFQGKLQIMDDPIAMLSGSEVPAHLRKGRDCCSVLPIAFLDVAKFQHIRTGLFSYHYFYDYFIRDTAVYGKEHMRPLNGIDAGVGKPQIGF